MDRAHLSKYADNRHSFRQRSEAFLHRDKKAKEQRIAELEGRAYDVQMLKFGQLIDLSVLDRMGSNKGADDLRESLKKQELQHAMELEEWNRKIEQSLANKYSLTAI
eukprot:1180232-Prorocentrum_minimum.AAC.2